MPQPFKVTPTSCALSAPGSPEGRFGIGSASPSESVAVALSWSLSVNAAPRFGADVTAIEPGGFRTDWAGRSMTLASRTIDDYEPLFAPIYANNRYSPRGLGHLITSSIMLSHVCYPLCCNGRWRDDVHGVPVPAKVLLEDVFPRLLGAHRRVLLASVHRATCVERTHVSASLRNLRRRQ